MKLIIYYIACFSVVLATTVQREAIPPWTKNMNFINERVVGGENASPHQSPYIVSMRRVYDDGRRPFHFCGGVIIAPQYVTTAAHCLLVLPLPEGQNPAVAAGRYDLSGEEETEQVRPIEHYYVHENYAGGVAPHDIGIIHLLEAFEFNSAVSPIKLPEQNFVHYGLVRLFGWGVYDVFQQLTPYILQTVYKPVVPHFACEAVVGGPGSTPLSEFANVCTGPIEGDISACSGDSGGPIVQEIGDGEVELVGLASWAFFPCGFYGLPSMYVRVSSYVDWLKEKMEGGERKLKNNTEYLVLM